MKIWISFLLLFSWNSMAQLKSHGSFSSGLELITFHSEKVPLVTIVLVMEAGAFTETPDIDGLTHLWEHMFFKGNETYPDQLAFKERIKELGIVYNGTTGAETVKYFITLPSLYLKDGLEFIHAAIATPKIDLKELDKERLIVLDEYDRNASQPGFALRKARSTALWGELAYRRDPLGTRGIIETASQDQLLRIKDEVFVPKNSAIIVSGSFPQNKIKSMVSKAFASWKNPKDWEPVKTPDMKFMPQAKKSEPTRLVAVDPQVRNIHYSLSFEGPKAREKTKDSHAADVLIFYLAHRGSDFYKKYVESGLTLGAGVNYYTQSQAAEMGLYATMIDPLKLSQVAEALKAEPALWLKDGYFDQSILEDVKRSLSINHMREKESPSEFAKSIAFWWSVTDFDYMNTYIRDLNQIGVTDLKKVIQDYFVDKPFVESILIDPESAKKIKLKSNL